MNTLIQTLYRPSDGLPWQIAAKVLCPDHLANYQADVIYSAESHDPCVLCQENYYQDIVEWRKKQVLLINNLKAWGLTKSPISLYIGGPMTGLPDHNKPAFWRMEKLLQQNAYNVLTPARYEGTHSYEWYIAQDIKLLLDADGVVLLTGWKKSKGATLEERIAKMTGKKVFKEIP